MMRKTYSRVGFSVVALYGVMSVVTAVILLVIMFGVLFTNFSELLLMIRNMGPQDAFNLFFNEKYTDLVLLGSTLGSAVGMGAGLLVMRAILKKPEAQIEQRDLTATELLLLILSAFGLWGLGALIGNIPEFFGVLSLDLTAKDPYITLFFCIYAVLGAPVLEELAFRKLILDRVHPYGELIGALTSALLFGLFHGNAAQFPLAFGFGIVSSLVYLKTGKISYSILLHMLINLMGTSPELFGLLHIDITIPWYVIAGALMTAGLIVWFLKRKEELFVFHRSAVPDANRQAFKNPGMLVAVIGGLATVGVTEISLLFSAFMSYLPEQISSRPLVRLIPITAVVIIVVMVLTRSRKRTDPERTELPEPDPFSGSPDV